MARTRLVLAAFVVAATMAGAVVLVSARAAHPATTPGIPRSAVPPVPSAPPDPSAPQDPPGPPAPGPPAAALARRVLAGLDRARAAAYADPLLGDPDDWAAPGCPCHAEDARRLRALARDGLALRSATTTLLAVTARPVTDSLEVLVVDRTSAYTAVDRTGRAVHRWPASDPRRWRIHLVRVAGRWLIGSVARAP